MNEQEKFSTENSTENKEEVKKTNKPSYSKVIVVVVVASIVLSSFFGAVFGFMAAKIGQGKFSLSNILKKGQSQTGQSGNSDSGQTINVPSEESAVIQAVKTDSPAVVSIIISKNVPQTPDFFSDPFFDPFGFQQQQPQPQNQNQGNANQKQEIGAGSGFIVTSDGLVVTNKHVISDPSADYTVMTSDQKKYDAKVQAIDPTNDLGILKINATNLPVLELGNATNLQIGQTVIAIGNSLGEFRNTVSKGVISGLKRNVNAGSDQSGQSELLSQVIQTDAAINPGNSGGPLLDIQGKVIGVNVAMAQGAENIGFALPVDLVKKDLASLKSSGKITQPYIGVRYVPIDAQIQKDNNLSFDYGALVVRGQQVTDFAVIPGSPADKAGIVENDIILEVNGTKVDADHPLANLLSQYGVGDTLTLKVWHKGNTSDVKVTLEERK
ncbi:MAG TPA: trypsin-like peptidase domain-containing protein [Candidatus Saccharimonadales bacterium]|nr:trypsin-like peptidase domain-containing protein [Candidatus Saccharimonadales bacterium]